MVWMADVELHAELREFPFPWSSLLFRGIALLGQALHCLVASAMGQVLWSGVIVLCPSGWVMR